MSKKDGKTVNKFLTEPFLGNCNTCRELRCNFNQIQLPLYKLLLTYVINIYIYINKFINLHNII